MRILVLSKRYFMGKDTALEGYGRFFELVKGLMSYGHSVKVCGLDYYTPVPQQVLRSTDLKWIVFSGLFGIPLLYFYIRRQLKQWCPDVLFVCSDIIHVALGAYIARSYGAKYVIDLHDNLEAFGLSKIPGISSYFRNAVRDADTVTCVSKYLRDKVQTEYRPNGATYVLENATNDNFVVGPKNKSQARARYSIPQQAIVIGIAGAINNGRGIRNIIEAVSKAREKQPELMLVLAGPAKKFTIDSSVDGVRYFGELPHQEVPDFMSTFDIGIVPNREEAFAQYCYPQKAVEMCALKIPIIAAKFGVMKEFAAKHEAILYNPESAEDIARALEYQINKRIALNVQIFSWPEQALRLNDILASQS